jgi:hypothetical protein
MKLRHPFEWLSASGQKQAFVSFVVLTLVLIVSLQVLGGPLKTEVAPMGIVSFEFAGELSKAQSMVESWGQKGLVYAGLNLGLDYLFLVAYASAVGLGCVLMTQRWLKRFEFVGLVGVGLSWGQWVAALLDGVENYALIRVLLGAEVELWPALARWCAVPKFILVGAGLLYIILGAIVVMVGVGRGHLNNRVEHKG